MKVTLNSSNTLIRQRLAPKEHATNPCQGDHFRPVDLTDPGLIPKIIPALPKPPSLVKEVAKGLLLGAVVGGALPAATILGLFVAPITLPIGLAVGACVGLESHQVLKSKYERDADFHQRHWVTQ